VVGFLGQKGFNILDSRHTESLTSPEASIQKAPFWQRAMQSKYSPMKQLSDEEYKKFLEDKLLRVDTEIAVIDDNIASLKKEDGVPNSEFK
jgi:hypothetical protein